MSWSPLNDTAPSDDALIGDEPFDTLSNCFTEVTRLYVEDLKRKPSLKELVGTIRAVLDTQLQDFTSDGETAELASLTFKTRKIGKRQKAAEGDILQAKVANGEPIYARVFKIDSAWGPFIGVYESKGMSPLALDEIIARPLIVKVSLIHPEYLEKRSWLVIGNRPLRSADDDLPRGPVALNGNNIQLDAANYHYKLGPKAFYNIDEYVVQRPGGG